MSELYVRLINNKIPMFDDNEQKEPFLIPSIVSLIFGLPVVFLWLYVALKLGWLATIITILLGTACGYGAKISSGGVHASGAALFSTLILISLSISLITVDDIAYMNDQTYLHALIELLKQGDFGDFATECVRTAGRTFMGYPLGLYAAYRASDTER